MQQYFLQIITCIFISFFIKFSLNTDSSTIADFDKIDRLKISKNQWQYYSFVRNSVKAMVVDKRETIWLGSQEIYERKSRKFWQKHEGDNIHDSIVNNTSCAFYSAKTDRIWFGSSNQGLSKFENNSWTRFENKGEDLFYTSIVEDNNANVMAKCHNYCFYLDNLTGHQFLYKDKIKEVFEHPYCNLTLDNSGYISTLFKNSIVRFKNEKWEETELPEEFKHSSYAFSNIAFNNKGDCWISVIHPSHGKKLIKISNDGYQIFYTKDLPHYFEYITNICVDENGDAWFGLMYYGVAKFDCKKWITFTPQNSLLSDKYVNKIHLDNKNRVLIAAKSGLFIFLNEKKNPWK